MNNKVIPTVIIVLLVVLVGGGYLASKNNASKSSTTSSITPTPTETPIVTSTTASITPTTTGIVSFDVEAGSFFFKPSVITVKKGDKVKINLSNNSSMMHDFTLDDFNVHSKPVRSGETDSVEFTADKSGTFEYYCSMGAHRQMGQVGKLIIQ